MNCYVKGEKQLSKPVILYIVSQNITALVCNKGASKFFNANNDWIWVGGLGRGQRVTMKMMTSPDGPLVSWALFTLQHQHSAKL